MFDEKIKEIEANIGTLNTDIANKIVEVKNALEANDLDKARAIKSEIAEAKNSLKTAEADLDLYKTTAEKGFTHPRFIEGLIAEDNIETIVEKFQHFTAPEPKWGMVERTAFIADLEQD